MDTYNEAYFETGNYQNYTRGRYRAWHWVKYLWLGMWFKLFGVKKIFDFGCADAVSVAAFRMWGIEAWGCDISPYAISRAPSIAKNNVWAGELTEKQFADKYFDLVVSFDVIEHIAPEELDLVANNLAKIARRGIWGIYVQDELIAKIHRVIGKDHPDHLSEHNSKWWEKWFKKHRFVAKHLFGSRRGTYLLDFSII